MVFYYYLIAFGFSENDVDFTYPICLHSKNAMLLFSFILSKFSMFTSIENRMKYFSNLINAFLEDYSLIYSVPTWQF